MSHPLISAQELAANLGDAGWRLVDCRFDLANPDWGGEQYAASHLPGAVYAHLDHQLSGPRTADSGRHPLPSPQAWADTLAAWGVRDDTTVVAYDQGNGAFASRLWWLLRAVGHQRVRVLDGGLAAWRAAGLPETADLAATRPVPRAPRNLEGWLTTAQVRDFLAAGEGVLVDARAADRFEGRNETIDPVAGHVPGAVNHPLGSNLGPDGRFLGVDALRARWQDTLRGHAPQQLVAMCGSGITACHNLLALEAAGLPGARLYAGSWSEWIRDPSRPVSTGG